MSVPTTRVLTPVFQAPILRAANNGTATWTKTNTLSQWQKGTGWQANLYGGVQTNDDWAAVFIPTTELRVTDFNSARWSYYMTGAQTMGVNIVIWVHNPDDLKGRAEITQLGNVSGLGKAAGWNSHALVKTTDQFFFYGENTTGTDLTAGTQYGWDDFQADPLFKNWTIYRVSLEYGWEASGTFDNVWVVEVILNGLQIPLKPSIEEILSADTALAQVTLLANSGVDIGDVDVTSIVPGTAATNLGKAEDAAHTSGDTGIMSLAVRKDVPSSFPGTDGDYTPLAIDKWGGVRQAQWLFGQPEIRCDNEGWGQWEKKALQAKFKDSYDTNRHFRYGNWAVHLNGGPQASEEAWASVSIPINEMRVSEITSIAYDWYAQYTGSAHILDIGPNLVFSAYDPTDHAKRVDFNTYAIDNNIFMDDGLANRPVEAGWYKYKMTSTDATERVYWYGNNTGAHDTAPAEGADGYWSQFITDSGFKDWMVYRIQIMIGYWGATRSTGDVWIDAPKINGIPVEWKPSEDEQIEIEKRNASMIGEPSLASANNGCANWARGIISPLDQKSPTGWLACLYGGVQTGDDWARVNIPIKEMHVPDFKTAMWTYWMTAAETMGVNMVIWVHDPFDPGNRAEITQLANVAGLGKAAGWNDHELNPSTTQFFFYGEGTTNTNLVAGTQYGWDDFVSDELFNTWTIYRITFEYGWEASGTFEDAFVADIKINGEVVPLKPDSGGTGRIQTRRATATTEALAGTLAPKTPFYDLVVMLHISAVETTGTQNLTINVDAGVDDAYDTNLLTIDTVANAILNYVYDAGKVAFWADDEIDIALVNTDDKECGLTMMCRTV